MIEITNMFGLGLGARNRKKGCTVVKVEHAKLYQYYNVGQVPNVLFTIDKNLDL